jgi:hypothetical protein
MRLHVYTTIQYGPYSLPHAHQASLLEQGCRLHQGDVLSHTAAGTPFTDLVNSCHATSSEEQATHTVLEILNLFNWDVPSTLDVPLDGRLCFHLRI